MDVAPPEHLDLGPGLWLARSRRADAEGVAAAVAASLDHLRPFMPWATGPAATVAAQRARLADVEHRWDAGEEFDYTIRGGPAGAVVGGCGLMTRLGPGILEIGYWVHVAACRRGVATRAAGALTEAARCLPGVGRVVIRCDEANVASAAVARRLGYDLERVEEGPVEAPGQTGRMLVWVLGGAPPG